MDRACENCRFCVYAHSMRGKEEPYCERHSKWIGDTILCSEWEMVCVPRPQTNADRIRSMTDEELANFLDRVEMGDVDYSKTFCDLCDGFYDCHDDCLLGWLRAEATI